MDMPGDYYGSYPPPPGPHYPQNDPPYPHQQQQPPPPPYNPYPPDAPTPPAPPFNGPPPDPNFNYHHPHQLPPPPVNGPADSFGGGGGFWPGGGGGGGGGYSAPFHGRKRPRHAPQHGDGPGYPKLYVASVPRTAKEEDIRPVFEPHGRVVEIILLWDKRTGLQQGSCFVKYATPEEADRAIRALNDKFTFQGELCPVKVRYADGERERMGYHKNSGGQWAGPPPPATANGDNFGPPPAVPPPGFKGDYHGGSWGAPPPGFKAENKGLLADKVYVSGVNRQATKQEIEEIFAAYGVVEDVFIIRDEMKQSRGCAFVKYSHGDMAMAAIKSLNGSFIMRGCDLPLTVRFAEPKKPRIGEPRGAASSGSYFGNHSREPFNRPPPPPPPPSGNSMGGFALPPVSSHQVQQQFNSPVPKQALPDHRVMQQPVQPSAAPQPPQCSVPLIETPDGSRAPQEAESEMQPQQPQNLQESNEKPEVAQAPVDSQTALSTCTTSTEAKATAASVECDWSQHICPDGFKYYYNCVTHESAWEKPEEYARYEQELEQQRSQPSSGQDRSQSSVISSGGQINQAQHMQIQDSLFHPEKMQAGTGPAIVPACG